MMLAIDAGWLPVGQRGQRVGNALRQIAQPGGEHNHGANQRAGGM